MKNTASIIIWIVALFYFYGAAVHVMNMFSLTGFDWGNAPAKWQTLDIVYLVIDIIVVIGLILGWRIGFGAFYLAAVSQIILYTAFKGWITDVPSEFAVSESQMGYLTDLVVFHCVTLLLVSSALWMRSQSP